ncbi:glycosyltransferase family 9 protein [Geobacter anodireducens]
MTASPASILIINIRLIGDVILTTPLVGILKNAFPDAAIDFLVNRGTGEFLEKDPRVRRVIYSEKGSVAAGGGREGGYLGDIFRRYDLAITMNASDRGSVAALLAGTKTRVGFFVGERWYTRLWKRLLFDHLIPMPYSTHVALLNKLVANALGVEVGQLRVTIYWDGEDEARVDQFLAHAGVTGPFFVIHPFARWRYKYWQMERIAALSDRVAERYGLCPVWTSSPSKEEVALLELWAGQCRYRPALVKGEFSLNQMSCLLSRSSLYLGLDTAITHLAAAAGVPLVACTGQPSGSAGHRGTMTGPWPSSAPCRGAFSGTAISSSCRRSIHVSRAARPAATTRGARAPACSGSKWMRSWMPLPVSKRISRQG